MSLTNSTLSCVIAFCIPQSCNLSSWHHAWNKLPYRLDLHIPWSYNVSSLHHALNKFHPFWLDWYIRHGCIVSIFAPWVVTQTPPPFWTWLVLITCDCKVYPSFIASWGVWYTNSSSLYRMYWYNLYKACASLVLPPLLFVLTSGLDFFSQPTFSFSLWIVACFSPCCVPILLPY